MNNQAAQTMPSIATLPFVTVEQVQRYRAESLRVEAHRNELLNQVAALSQTAGVAVKWEVRRRFWSGAPWGPWESYETEAERTESFAKFEGSEWLHETRELFAAAPAASGGERVPLSERLYRGPAHDPSGRERGTEPQSTPEPMPPAGASVSERARAILSQAYRDAGFDKAAEWVLHVDLDNELYVLDRAALRAIEQALTQQRGECESPSVKEIVPAEKRNYLDDNGNPRSIEDEAYAHGWNACRSAILKAIEKRAPTTPQPGAEALRELVQRWRFMSDPYHGKCADELESLLARGGK